MRLLYKPFGIIGAIVASMLGRKAFDSIWAKIDDQQPPKPGTGQSTAVKVIGAQALRASVMAASAAAVDRALAHGFHYAIGIWPKKPPKPKKDKQKS
jgi:hypothetical protein